MNELIAKITSLEQSTALDDMYYYNMIHERVCYLLAHEINQLFHVLYRIDISEQQVKNAFSMHEGKEDISKHLTLLIIDRLKQKIELRKKYASKK